MAVTKYFTVEVKPVMTPVADGLHTAFSDGDVLFDWTSFEIPRGGGRLIGAHVEIRPKGDTGSTPNIFPLELLFAKTKYIAGTLTAPSTLGILNTAATAPSSIYTQTEMFLGHLPIIAGDFGDTDSIAVASAASGKGIVLQGEINSGNNVGYDEFYVSGIAGGAFNFVSGCTINAGDLDGPVMTVADVDPRLFIAVGDTVAVTTTADTDVTKAMGVVKKMTDVLITLESAFTTADVVDDDFVYNTSPIKIILTFER